MQRRLKAEINSDNNDNDDKNNDDDITFVDKQPLHARDRLRRQTKDDNVTFVHKRPQNP